MKEKCYFCKKKVGYMGFTCKCNHIYCKKHRYTHSHNCIAVSETKQKEKEKIETKNPKIDYQKVVQL